MHLVIVLAAYQEAETLKILLPQISAQAKMLDIPSVETVVVNDWGARDEATEKCCQTHGVTLLNTPCNLGSQGAIVYGLKEVVRSCTPPSIVVTMDADGQDDIQALDRLLAACMKNPDGVIVAQRVGKRPEGGRFSLGYNLYKVCFKMLTGVCPDFGNYAAYSGKTAERIAFSPLFDLAYSMALPLVAPLTRVPVRRLKRLHGKTRIGWGGLFDHALKSFLPHLSKVAFRIWLLSFIFGGLSLLVAVFAIGIKWLSPENAFPNWTTQIVSFSILFCLGMLTLSILLFLASSISRQISSVSRHHISYQKNL